MELQGKRCLVPRRLSQKGESQTGLDTQDKDTREWIKAEGGTVVASPQDHISGDKAPWERKNLGPWMTEPLHIAEYDAIVVSTQDRLSRGKWADEIEIRLWVERNQKEIFVCDTRLHWPPRDLSDQIRWELGATSAREEWLKVKKRTDRMRRELREGNYLVGQAGYGYRRAPRDDHKTLVIDDDEAAVIRRMVSLYLDQDMSTAQIAKALDADGIPTPSGRGTWSSKTILQILRNPMITGRRKAGTYRNPGKTLLRVEPIIDVTTFNRVQKKMQSRAHNRSGASPGTAMLSGVLFCGKCHGPMYRLKGWGGKLYYRCHGTDRHPSTCKAMVPLEEMDRAVLDLIYRLYHKTEYEETEVIPGENWDDEIHELEQDIKDLDLDDPEFLSKQAALLAERERLRNLPRKPDRVITKSWAPYTVADYFTALPDNERRGFLLKLKQRLEAIRQPDGNWTVYPAHHASVR